MASIVIYVSNLQPAETGDDVVISGFCRLSGMTQADDPIPWSVQFAPTTLAATINAAIRDSAIAAAEAEDFEIGLLDKKTLIGGAIGL